MADQTKADKARKLAARGVSVSDIAAKLEMRPATVRLHLSRKAGAGRPKLETQGKRRLSVLVSVETAEWLQDAAENDACGAGEVMDGLLLEAAEHARGIHWQRCSCRLCEFQRPDATDQREVLSGGGT